MSLFITLVSFIVFILVNYCGSFVLELFLLSFFEGSEKIVFIYRIGSMAITGFIAFPLFLAINKVSFKQVKALFSKSKNINPKFILFISFFLIVLTVIPLLLIRFFLTDISITPPDIINGVWLVLITPFIEEIVFRGVILQKLKKYGIIPAILISTFLFLMGHGNVGNMLISFFPGIILAIVVIKSESISYTIPLHMLVNLCGSVIVPLILYSWS